MISFMLGFLVTLCKTYGMSAMLSSSKWSHSGQSEFRISCFEMLHCMTARTLEREAECHLRLGV